MRFLFDAIERQAAARPGGIALSDDNGALTWRDLRDRLADSARWMEDKGPIIGLAAPNGLDYVIAMLAAAHRGRTLVPLPLFFSDDQLGRIVIDAGIDAIVTTESHRARAATFGAPAHALTHDGAGGTCPAPCDDFRLVIYTSGSTGTPKGVVHSTRQIEAVTRGLASASGGSAADSYLSVLPLPMLLETICAVFLPILCGARAHFATAFASRVAAGDGRGLAPLLASRRPTAIVLVPQLLRSLVGELQALGMTPPASLRFVAVGGAAVPAPVLEAAERMGIPVFEGYGLSECCSVVAMNRPGARRTGTAGLPLDGVSIAIDEGEIVVSSPGVMAAYLGGAAAGPAWRTGDLGSIDADGFLTVHGRKDNLIVTSFGRNIAPEWIEAALMADPRIALAAVTGGDGAALDALLIVSPQGEAWIADDSIDAIRAAVTSLCRDLPDFAIPVRLAALSLADAARAGLLTSNGRIVRAQVRDFLARNHSPLAAE